MRSLHTRHVLMSEGPYLVLFTLNEINEEAKVLATGLLNAIPNSNITPNTIRYVGDFSQRASIVSHEKGISVSDKV